MLCKGSVFLNKVWGFSPMRCSKMQRVMENPASLVDLSRGQTPTTTVEKLRV